MHAQVFQQAQESKQAMCELKSGQNIYDTHTTFLGTLLWKYLTAPA